MKKIIVLFTLMATFFFACKEEEISTQQFVQNHIVGSWPLKMVVNITKENGTIIKNDTLIYGLDSPAVVRKLDTVQFTADGKFIKKIDTVNYDTVNYSIDGEGKNIIFSRDTIGTWFIQYLRIKSIILTQEKTEKIGSKTFIYYKEQQLIK